MRIAIANSWRAHIGGVETYLSTVLPALITRGHQVVFLHEDGDCPGDAGIPLGGAEDWPCGARDEASALARLRTWKPDVIYAHGLRSHALEARLVEAAPAVAYVHGYYGTCISGTKTLTRPAIRPCTRRFGPACLWHYFPRGCGGRSPLSMWRHYRLQQGRLSLLTRYRAVLVASAHMADEYRRHGLREHVRVVPLPVVQGPVPPRRATAEGPWRLLYLGRFERLKGVLLLIDAAKMAAAVLDRAVRLTIAGRGPVSGALTAQAAACAGDARVDVRIRPWLGQAEKAAELAGTDLILVPSLWPEPFGLFGVEAGTCGIPAAAAATGGVGEWLEEGVNGALANGWPLTSAALADAIVRCLASGAHYRKLATGARAQAARFGLAAHLEHLERELQTAASGSPRMT